MTDCYLTERQKDLLRSLVPGLQDGTIGREWSLHTGGDSIMGIWGLDDAILWNDIWHEIDFADFDDFIDCGFFRQKGDGVYTLNVQKIIAAADRNFSENAPSQSQINQGASITVTPIFGLPSKSRQLECDIFMMMPFKEEFRPIYDNHIKRAVEALHLKIIRGDEPFTGQEILSDIWSAIYNARLIIVDCTGQNPNVFYEFGVAHTLGKPAIVIAQNQEDVRFDIQGKRYIPYENTPEGLQLLEEALKTAIMKLMSELDA